MVPNRRCTLRACSKELDWSPLNLLSSNCVKPDMTQIKEDIMVGINSGDVSDSGGPLCSCRD